MRMKLESSYARIKCEECDHIFDVDSEDLDVQEQGMTEREMGPEIFYSGEMQLDCPRCLNDIEITYEFSEYPIGVASFDETYAEGAEVIIEFSSVSIYYKEEIYNYDKQLLLFVPEEKRIITDLSAGVSELLQTIKKSPELIYGIQPRQFEELIAHIFSMHGFLVELTKKTRDGGRDIIAIRSDLDIKLKYLIECKRNSMDNPVSVDIVRALYGVQMQESANKSILATTSRFTADAMKFATEQNTTKWGMDLKDINAIRNWISTTPSK